jgi:anti-sigma-K factor RskA
MNDDRQELIELLAAEYVIGTLRGSARRRFERICSSMPAASAARQRWEDRFATLALDLDPIQPRAQTWQAIHRHIAPATVTSMRPRMRRRHWLPLAAAAAVLGVALWLVPQWVSTPTQIVAVLGADAQHPQWRIERSADAHQLRVTTLGAMTSNPQRAFELWALPRDGKPPVSLGLLPRAGNAALTLSIAQTTAVLAAGKLAVSIEPPGGSPTGAPTGPVIMLGEVGKSS